MNTKHFLNRPVKMTLAILRNMLISMIFCIVGLRGGLAATVAYTYDSLNRITKVTTDKGGLTGYHYDAAGNRLSQTVAAGAPLVVLASPIAGGTVTGSGNFPVGSLQSISAQPTVGWAFLGWNDNGAQPIRLIAIPSGGITYTAFFDKTPFTKWQEAHFTIVQLSNPNISGPNADPDGDGITNAQEFANNLDPNAFNKDKIDVGFNRKGNKPLVIRDTSITIRGTTSSLANIVRVEYRIGTQGKFKPAQGTTSWHFKVHLPVGKSIIAVQAIDIKGKKSTPTNLTVIRKGDTN